MNAEKQRIAALNSGSEEWRLWGPYLSERQWGTVREDYSPNGAAWEYFSHDQARSRAYRWGEDGLAGFSDSHQRLCLALALWNGKDPIVKERLFGLTNAEGNHGEDVKELYFYLDATPSLSYLKFLYKYPQREFPYAHLREENSRRRKDQPEFELLETGLFDDDRYFDVFVEYAKAGPEDILMRVTLHNRGPDEAGLWLLPHLWFRNTWSWKPGASKPSLRAAEGNSVMASHAELGSYRLWCEGAPTLLFCDNETNVPRVFGQDGTPGFFKDAFHEYVVRGNSAAVNPQRTGTKAAALYKTMLAAGATHCIRLRLVARTSKSAASQASSVPVAESNRLRQNHLAASSSDIGDAPDGKSALADFDAVVALRRREADEFYAELQRDIADADARNVQRQAFAGLIWSQQYFCYDVPEWLRGDPAQPPPPPERKSGRNHQWTHLNNAEVLSMPDTWEYPWYAAWDLAFHCIALALIDAEFAKAQLVLLTREWYMHPNGQLPAYEWAFGDVNPPVHGWAAWRVFQIDRKRRRVNQPADPGDLVFLERVFHKLLLNFTWWVNREDAQGRNIFQGGFLGLDNIGVFDRSAALPGGEFINQADGTSWMAMYCLNLLRIALELARHNRVYEDIATKFFEHFLGIAAAINGVEQGALGLWDQQDEFYYDALNLPDGEVVPLKVRSIVGLIPLFAVEVLEPGFLKPLPGFTERMRWFLEHRPDLANLVSRWHERGTEDRRLLSLLRGHRMKCLLRRMLDESEFLSDYGVRSLSKIHEHEPYRLDCGGEIHTVQYWPGESQNGLFGGNSNWRGPVWMPVNYLLIESLQRFHHYYGNDFKIECPTRSGQFVTLLEAANELSRRLTRLFLKDASGQRPAVRHDRKLAADPHFRDCVLFHEYFHGDTGQGLGASHQTGWTALAAKLLMPRNVRAKPPDGPQANIASCGTPQSR